MFVFLFIRDVFNYVMQDFGNAVSEICRNVLLFLRGRVLEKKSGVKCAIFRNTSVTISDDFEIMASPLIRTFVTSAASLIGSDFSK